MAGKITSIFAVASMVWGGLLGKPDAALALHATANGTTIKRLERLARIDGIQCVPYARAVSGIQIFGNARTWWEQAKGHYARGFFPRVGAVMTFRPYGPMALGHVATVSRIIDSRTVLLRHANWSPIAGRRGQIEHDVPAVDTSPDNDWSKVRVWFDPVQGLGSTGWPVQGFIYPKTRTQRPGNSDHGVVGDPIGVIIAAYRARALPDRTAKADVSHCARRQPYAEGGITIPHKGAVPSESRRSHRKPSVSKMEVA